MCFVCICLYNLVIYCIYIRCYQNYIILYNIKYSYPFLLLICSFFIQGIIINLDTRLLDCLFPQCLFPQYLFPQCVRYFTDAYVLSRVPNVFLLMGTVFFAVQLLGCTMLSRPHQNSEVQLNLMIFKT